MSEKVFGVYIRVSTDKQFEDGDSIEMQEELARDLIRGEDGILYRIYVEGGVSATKTKLKDRKVLLECLDDAKKGLFNNLIAYKRDRLARKPEDSMAIRRMLSNANCSLHFTARDEQKAQANDPYGNMIENIMSSMAEIESANTATRVSDTMYSKAKKGEFTGGNVTYGYKNANGRLIPIESEVPVIQEVADMYLEGYGKHSIIKWLENEPVRNKGKRGIRATKLKQHKRSSEKWTIDTIDAILFNRTYSGYMEYTKDNKDGDPETISVKSEYITPIRSEEDQIKIDALRRKKNELRVAPRRYNTTFLLTGLLTCGVCGKDFSSRTVTKSNNRRYSYYICKGRHQRTAEVCQSNSYKKEILEQFVLEEAKYYLKQVVDSDVYSIVKSGLEEKDSKLESQLDEVEVQLAKTERDFKSISRLLLDLDTDDDMYEMMKDMYQKQQKEVLMRLNDLKQAKEKIEEELDTQVEENINVNDIISQLQHFGEIIDNSPIHVQKQALETLFNRLEIDKEGRVNYSLSINVRDTETAVDVATIGRVEESRDGIMFLGGVGDTTPSKNITIKSDEKMFTLNFFDWLESLLDMISETFYSFIISKNAKLNSPTHFSKMTNISIYTHRDYKQNKRVPSYKNLEVCLKVAGSSINEYVRFLEREVVICNEKILQEVTSDTNIIRRSIRRKIANY